MSIVKKILAAAAASLMLTSCMFLHDDQLVARVYGKKLYKSQVVKFIPPGLPAEDSLRLASQYIDAWAGELIMNEMASRQLSKKEKDISREIEEYRNSLLKYRYEQHYIEERLDTTVSEEQIREHYEANPGLYAISVPIVKARYIRIASTSPLHDELCHLMSSSDEEDLRLLDSLSYSNCEKYTDYAGRWIDMVALGRDFNLDYGTLIGAMKDSFIEIVDEQGTDHIAYIEAFIPHGKVPPLDYCHDKIRDVIIGQRKFALSSTLEQELIDEARNKGNYIIYENDEK